MSPVTMGPFGPFTAGLRRVSDNPSHFRSGRWFLLTFGLLVGALGVAGFVSSADQPRAAVLGLTLTPWHSAVLVGFAVAAIAATFQRHAAIMVTAGGAVVFLLLIFVGAVAATRHEPGPLGFDAPGIVLHGVLAAANLALLYWLIPDTVEGPAWVKRRNRRGQAGGDRGANR